MRQRGAIARGLATDPAVLLMDEPFAALDAQTREILQGEVERIWSATRKTVIFVTHNVREAVRLADRVILLGTRPGRVLHEEMIDLPRPREANDVRVSALANSIGHRIASEVEKVAREEADDAWVAPGSGSGGDPRRQRGRGI
jgi:NitT/TauT family transport system ATP-binding protein